MEEFVSELQYYSEEKNTLKNVFIFPLFPQKSPDSMSRDKTPHHHKKQRNVKVELECKYLKLLDAIQY